jgi:hypothetical protein
MRWLVLLLVLIHAVVPAQAFCAAAPATAKIPDAHTSALQARESYKPLNVDAWPHLQKVYEARCATLPHENLETWQVLKARSDIVCEVAEHCCLRHGRAKETVALGAVSAMCSVTSL